MTYAAKTGDQSPWTPQERSVLQLAQPDIESAGKYGWAVDQELLDITKSSVVRSVLVPLAKDSSYDDMAEKVNAFYHVYETSLKDVKAAASALQCRDGISTQSDVSLELHL